jgi:hypothetical protein
MRPPACPGETGSKNAFLVPTSPVLGVLRWLENQSVDPGAPGERYQEVVHVDAPALADPDQPGQSVLEDGTHVFRRNVAAPGLRREPRGDAA